MARSFLKKRGYTLRAFSFELDNIPEQHFYVVFPSDRGAERSLAVFVLIGGNAMTALDWTDWITELSPNLPREELAAFILVDFPGYGRSSGEPSPLSMHESTDRAVRLALGKIKNEGISVKTLNILGHSIGAAVACRLVSSLNNPNDMETRIGVLALSAPFTSIPDMMSIVVPFLPLRMAKMFARHTWDNVEALQQVIERNLVREVVIIHGNRDEIVPYAMGVELSKRFHGRVRFLTVNGASHNNVLSFIEKYAVAFGTPKTSS